MRKRSKSTGAKRSFPNSRELDRAWKDVTLENTSSAYRERLPTPHDENPLRFDKVQSESSGAYRDKLPTQPDVDPTHPHRGS